ncbi:MAG: T9SS type A sorting domain-containing protein [bacterium]|nr:T9SS type A sorting domain-containing protein [bacterium]
MLKNVLIFSVFIFLTVSVYGQLVGTSHKIIDTKSKETYNLQFNSTKRSAASPKQCDRDTIEYPRYKGSAFYVVTVSKGRALGQLYSTPKPLTLSGFSFYAFISSPPTKKKMNLICNVYKAGADSLPKGLPLRSDTITIDSVFGGGVLAKIEKHASFASILLDSAYILTVETDSATLNAGIVTNSYSAGDGKKENLNCGSISGQWYNGKNLNIGGVSFNADILLHPHVSYKLGTDFTIKAQCYNLNDTVKFTNQAGSNMLGSRMYNRYLLYNLGYYCHWWNAGNSFGYTYSVDHKVKYAQKQNYKVQLISTVYGYRGMANGCMDTTEKWLYYKPDFPSISGPLNACVGDTVVHKISNADTGAIYEWYKKPTDALPFFKGNALVRNTISKSDTVYVRGNNHTCVTSFRTVILNVNAYPTTLSALNDSVCSGSKANLKGFTNIGNIEWFETPNSPNLLFKGAVYQTPVLSRDTFFYIQANNLGCIKGPRIKVSALVGSNFAPNAPLVSMDTIVCLATTSVVQLNASAGSGLTIRWFNAASGGSSVTTGSVFYFSPTTRGVKTFYADAYNGICGSSREPVEVTVEDFPKISKVVTDTICKGDSLRLSVVLPFGEAHWYDASSNGNLLMDGLHYNLMAGATQNYYVETNSSICKSTTRTAVVGIVNTLPTVVRLWGDTICAKNRATLKSKLTGPGTIHWFEYDTSSVELGKGTSYQTGILNGGKTFYGQPEFAGCYGPKQLVAPLVKPSPFSGFNYEVLTNQSVKVSPINAAGCSILWNFGDGIKNTSNLVTHKYLNPGTYQLKLILTSLLTGCKDSTEYTIVVGPSSIKVLNTLPAISIYPNPTNDVLNFELPLQIGSVSAYIYSMGGVLVISDELLLQNKKASLNVAQLSAGIYILKIEGFRTVLFTKE